MQRGKKLDSRGSCWTKLTACWVGNTFRPRTWAVPLETQHLSDVPVTLATASVSDEDIERLAELFNLTLVPPVASDDERGGRWRTDAEKWR